MADRSPIAVPDLNSDDRQVQSTITFFLLEPPATVA
jgi:hypothetical protein